MSIHLEERRARDEHEEDMREMAKEAIKKDYWPCSKCGQIVRRTSGYERICKQCRDKQVKKP